MMSLIGINLILNKVNMKIRYFMPLIGRSVIKYGRKQI